MTVSNTKKNKLIEISGLDISFSKNEDKPLVVNSVNLTLEKGKMLGVVGESGSGKTMLALSLLGLLPPGGRITGGKIIFDGIDLANATQNQLAKFRGREIGMIFQEPMMSLNPSLKIGFQLKEGLLSHQDLNRKVAHRLCIEMLEKIRMKEPETCLNKYPHEFSGGMRQRIMIASVLLMNPRLLIADEPTTALDVLIQKEVMEIMVDVADHLGTTILMISHDLGLIAKYADNVAVMRKGIVVEKGKVDEVILKPKHIYTRELLASLPQRVSDASDCSEVAFSNPFIQIEGLKVQFESSSGLFSKAHIIKAVDGIDLNLPKGQTTAIVGESGSGKTTLGRAIMGLTKSQAGRVLLKGADITNLGKKMPKRLRKELQMVFQDPFSSLDPRMRISAIVGEGLRLQNKKSLVDSQCLIERTLAEVGLDASFKDRFPHELSGGQRQRVCIARAIIVKPEFIVADEPVSSLDVTVQSQILKLIKKLQEKYEFTYFFISHDVGVVEQIADNIAVMYRGRFVETGSRNEIFKKPTHPYTCRLLESVHQLSSNEAGGYQLSSRTVIRHEPPKGFIYDDEFDKSNNEFQSNSVQMISLGGTHYVACRPN
jgi:peptide/nickel transport system ATP-binding protein